MSDSRPINLPVVTRTLSAKPIWPQLVIFFGLGLTAAWTILLAYRVCKLIGLMI